MTYTPEEKPVARALEAFLKGQHLDRKIKINQTESMSLRKIFKKYVDDHKSGGRGQFVYSDIWDWVLPRILRDKTLLRDKRPEEVFKQFLQDFSQSAMLLDETLHPL